jgi:two-component system LytT family response regulator
MPIRTLIVDDEPLARRGLRARLALHADIDIVAEAGNGREALLELNEHRPDLLLLDIQMPGLGGFDMLRSLPTNEIPLVVFVTAHDEYAMRAFEANALDYLLKPINRARLGETLQRVRRQLAVHQADAHCARLLHLLGTVSGQPELSLEQALNDTEAQKLSSLSNRLAIKEAGRTLRVSFDDIQWIDAAGDYVCVHTAATNYVVRAKMRELELSLDTRRFQRIHRSTIVNLDCVCELRAHANGEQVLILHSGQRLKLSRSYKNKVRLLH